MTRPWRRQGDTLQLAVRLTPKSRQEALGNIWTGADDEAWLSARVTARAEKGMANAALIALVARALGCPPTSISLEAGATARLKRLRIAPADAMIEAALTQLTERT